MNESEGNRDIALIDDLCSLPAETSWFEFKHNNAKPDEIGKRCSALSNSARIAEKDFAYLVWGVEDATHKVIGTTFEPNIAKVGNQELELWLANSLNPSIAFEFVHVDHPNGKVVLLKIPATTTAPISFNSIPYIRVGSTTPKLTDYPERFQQLIERLHPYRWEFGIAKEFITESDVLRLLDYKQYFALTKQPLPENTQDIFDKLKADKLIESDLASRWKITNLGALLFANQLKEFGSAIERKLVRLVQYTGKNKASTVSNRIDGTKGYAVGFQGLLSFIQKSLPKNEHIGVALREVKPIFPELAIRELVANALIHQDMTVSGAGPQIELFEDRMEITNPGSPLIQPDRMIDLPPRSRNEALASLMRRMGMCEEQGSGLDKVIQLVEIFQSPAPLFSSEDNSFRAVLYAPRTFAQMTPEERTRACYFHAVLKHLSSEKMKNASLCTRLGIDPKNASQATTVINKTLEKNLIRIADTEHPRAGYLPFWA